MDIENQELKYRKRKLEIKNWNISQSNDIESTGTGNVSEPKIGNSKIEMIY